MKKIKLKKFFYNKYLIIFTLIIIVIVIVFTFDNQVFLKSQDILTKNRVFHESSIIVKHEKCTQDYGLFDSGGSGVSCNNYYICSDGRFVWNTSLYGLIDQKFISSLENDKKNSYKLQLLLSGIAIDFEAKHRLGTAKEINSDLSIVEYKEIDTDIYPFNEIGLPIKGERKELDMKRLERVHPEFANFLRTEIFDKTLAQPFRSYFVSYNNLYLIHNTDTIYYYGSMENLDIQKRAYFFDVNSINYNDLINELEKGEKITFKTEVNKNNREEIGNLKVWDFYFFEKQGDVNKFFKVINYSNGEWSGVPATYRSVDSEDPCGKLKIPTDIHLFTMSEDYI